MDEEASLEEMARIILNESNVRSIVPLFHEPQMDEYLKRCDDILCKIAIDPIKWSNYESRSEKL